MVQKQKEPSLRNRWTAGSVLREESPTIVRHLADGCPTCNAGLQVFHQIDARTGAPSAVEQFEKELAASLAAAESPVNALHAALADLAVRRGIELRCG